MVDQAASDLEENRRRQQELAEQISVLRQEEALLTDILNLAQRYQGFFGPVPAARAVAGRARRHQGEACLDRRRRAAPGFGPDRSGGFGPDRPGG
ncbi:hypothetical protein GCM10020295_02420 [Streptomyces cinereospinus]